LHVHRGDNPFVTSSTGGRLSTDRHASRASMPVAERGGPDYYYRPADADELDEFCPGCTPELGPDGWQHDRGCVFARRRTA